MAYIEFEKAPHEYKDWHFFRVFPTGIPIDWLRDNIRKDYTMFGYCPADNFKVDHTMFGYYWYFKDLNDAILFKMTWAE